MSGATEQIKQRLSIAEVIGSYITLEKAGGNLKARCPFHGEKTPSFFVSPERGTYYCFGCGAKGDIFSFVEEFEGVDFRTSLHMLADRAGVNISDFENGQKEDPKKELFSVMEEATIFFQNNLKDEKDALLYLKGRGLTIETVKNYRIGFAKDEWRSLKDALQKRVSEKILLDAGLIKQGEKGSYDRFRARVMFPIFDTTGRVIAFSGRTLKKDTEEAKYLNSPDTPLFDKSKVLFGYHVAKKSFREKGRVILVEGQMDLLLCHQAGYTEAVASSGTAFTAGHAELLKRHTDKLLIAYDSDKAGQNASMRAWQHALASGFEVELVLLPAGLDPADAIQKDIKIWEDALQKAQNIILYYLQILGEAGEENREKILKEKILPLIASVESSIQKAKYISKVAFALGVPESSVSEEVSKVLLEEVGSKEEIKQYVSPAKKESGAERSMKLLLAFLRSGKSPHLEKVLKEVERITEKSFAEEESDEIIYEAEAYYSAAPNIESVIEEALYILEDETLKEKFVETMSRLKKAESSRDGPLINSILKECSDLSKSMRELKNKYFNK